MSNSVAPPRNQARSAFTDILEDLVARAQGVEGAAFVDKDGETVDYAGRLEPFSVKIAGAHLQLVLAELISAQLAEAPLSPAQAAQPGAARLYRKPALASLGGVQSIAVRADRRSFVAHGLCDGYSLVLVMTHRSFLTSPRAIMRAVRLLAREAGWADVLAEPEAWRAIEVQSRKREPHRPVQVKLDSKWEAVEVLGTVVGLRHEHGYRVRTSAGAEVTIVRESLGHWYAEMELSL